MCLCPVSSDLVLSVDWHPDLEELSCSPHGLDENLSDFISYLLFTFDLPLIVDLSHEGPILSEDIASSG